MITVLPRWDPVRKERDMIDNELAISHLECLVYVVRPSSNVEGSSAHRRKDFATHEVVI